MPRVQLTMVLALPQEIGEEALGGSVQIADGTGLAPKNMAVRVVTVTRNSRSSAKLCAHRSTISSSRSTTVRSGSASSYSSSVWCKEPASLWRWRQEELACQGSS